VRDERQKALARGQPFENEQRACRKDGQYRWFLLRYNPILDELGRVLRWYATEFIPDIDFASFGNVADPGVWTRIHDEGVQIVENIANIRVPVIAAIEGRAHVHSEYALLGSVCRV
jgi:hypothetical protein